MAAASALLLAMALVAAAAAAGSAETTPRRSIAGRLLVATESMPDARFARTVIYVVRHDDQGALGLIINVPVGRVTFERALRPFGLDVPPASGDVLVHYGGPVGERRGFVLHTPDWKLASTTLVDGGLALTEDPTILQAMSRGAGPRRALFCLGYTGWAPGQLDAELTTGSWAIAAADERLVFDEDPNQKWIEAMTRRLLNL